MYDLNTIVSPPDMPFLNAALKTKKVLITTQGILYQEFKTADNVLECKHVNSGRFYGTGIHENSYDEVFKNGKLIFRSKNIDIVYKYFINYLKKGDKPIMKNFTGPFAYAKHKQNKRKKRLTMAADILLGLGLTGLIYALLIIVLGAF